MNIPNYATGNSAGFTGNLVGDVNGTQGATIVSKINGVALSSLATGILKNTSGTGVPSIAVASDFPILNQNTTGSAATAIAAANQAVGDSTTNIANTLFVTRGLSYKANKVYVDNLLTSKAPLASPDLTGTPTAPTATAGTKTTQIATTAFVDAAVTSKAPLASPDLTGTPTAPTASASANSTQIATTAYVDRADALKANLASPTFSGTVEAPTATATDSTTKVATTAFVKGSIKRSNITKGVIFNTSNGNVTINVNQMLIDGMYNYNPTASSKTLTTPTAAELIAGIASAGLGTAEVGDIFSVVFLNGNGSNSYTLAFGTGITNVNGNTSRTVSAGRSLIIYFRITNVTSGSQAISFYYQ